MNYQIHGEPMPVLVCDLEPRETIVCQSGAMSWMSPNMEMKTQGGGAAKVFGRMFSGESLMLNNYTAQGGPGMIAFASSFPGSIRAFEVTPGRSIIAQKRSFLACTPGVEVSVHFQRKLGAGFFGGEGFIMQKFEGSGMVFLEIDGSAMEYNLAPGQQIIIDTGYLAMMDASVQMEIQQVKGVKNVLFGGEGLFNTVLTGPGHIMLQTMPASAFAGAISSILPTKG